MCRSLDELKQRGIEEGLLLGKQQGEMIGIEKGKKEIILNMHNNGLSIEEIVKFISLDEHKILEYLKV